MMFQDKGAVYALGNFDGVHRGHQALIAAARALATPQGLPTIALTFAPHPRRYFAPDLPPFLLTNAEQKTQRLRAAGADEVLTLPFDAALAAMAAEDFAHQILQQRCKARGIIAGEDFRFGHNRSGDMDRLQTWLPAIPVQSVAAIRDAQGQRYATSTARALLQTGQVKAAADILGYEWTIRGMVQHGDARGRQLGFPTANIALGDYLRPLYGVYAIRATRVHDGVTAQGVANIGRRPTLDGNTEWLEAHFFDWNADLYNQEWDIALAAHLRPEQRFGDLDALKTAIKRDCELAKETLSSAANAPAIAR